MYNYMAALQQNFCPDTNDQEIRRRTEVLRSELNQKLDQEDRRRLLELIDMHILLREHAALENFISGFRLALGIALELSKDGRYSFFDDEEDRGRRTFIAEKGGRL